MCVLVHLLFPLAFNDCYQHIKIHLCEFAVDEFINIIIKYKIVHFFLILANLFGACKLSQLGPLVSRYYLSHS